MIALIIISAIILFFVLLFTIHVHITVEYKEDIAITLRILGIPIHILPKKSKKYKLRHYTLKKIRKREAKAAKRAAKKNKKKEQKPDSKKLTKTEKKALQTEKKANRPPISDIIPLVLRIAKLFFSKFFGKLHIKIARLKITVATGDAATTAMLYGALYPSASLFMKELAKISDVKGLKKADLAIIPDYLGEKTSFDIKLTFMVNLGGVLSAVIKTGFAFIMGWVKIRPDPQSKQAKTHTFNIPCPPIPPAPPSPFAIKKASGNAGGNEAQDNKETNSVYKEADQTSAAVKNKKRNSTERK